MLELLLLKLALLLLALEAQKKLLLLLLLLHGLLLLLLLLLHGVLLLLPEQGQVLLLLSELLVVVERGRVGPSEALEHAHADGVVELDHLRVRERRRPRLKLVGQRLAAELRKERGQDDGRKRARLGDVAIVGQEPWRADRGRPRRRHQHGRPDGTVVDRQRRRAAATAGRGRGGRLALAGIRGGAGCCG